MSVEVSDNTPVENRDQLMRWMEAGCKPKAQWRVGTEHEKFVFRKSDLKPAPYEPGGIAALLDGMAETIGWERVVQDDKLIGLSDPQGTALVSLEPGGQFELSGAPMENLHETSAEIDAHLRAVKAVGEKLGLGFLGLGFVPLGARADMPQMPKRRYDIMRAYMLKVGTMGLDMMHRTATVQVNLDFSSEQDMVCKLRIGLVLQPIVTALFAASPFTEGKPNGFKSFRSEIWRHTDADRTGMLPFAFDKAMSFARYVDWAIDVPMYFIKRGDRYIEVTGVPFRALLEGRVPQLPGERATISDWTTHLGTLFPEVRLKHFLEMRGADCGPLSHIKALPAFWTGLLYDEAAQAAAFALIKDWSAVEAQDLRDRVPKEGLAARFRNTTVQTIAGEAVAIAEQGLKARNRRDQSGAAETIYLEALQEIVKSGESLADCMLRDFSGRWWHSVAPVYQELAL